MWQKILVRESCERGATGHRDRIASQCCIMQSLNAGRRSIGIVNRRTECGAEAMPNNRATKRVPVLSTVAAYRCILAIRRGGCYQE